MSDENLTAREFAGFEGNSKQYILSRTRPGAAHPLSYRLAEDGITKLFSPSDLSSPDGQRRWLQSKMHTTANPPANQAVPVPAESPQFSLLPEVEADRTRLRALGHSTSEIDRAFRRFRAIQPLFNHDYAAAGFKSKKLLYDVAAEELNLSVRRVKALAQAYKQHEDVADLIERRPGPKPGTRTALDLSARAFIKGEYEKGYNYKQIYDHYKSYRKAKAESHGCRNSYHYKLAHRTTVERYINSLGAVTDAAREGPEALKAACGHIDRSYVDLASLERVESDECKLNLFSFDPHHAMNRQGNVWIRRYWLLTFYDTRSMFPLVWGLCEGSEYELRRGIAFDDELNLFVALIRTYGVPAAIHSDRGRFRGKVWGGEPYQQRIEKEFAPVNGILQRVGQLAGYPEGIRHDMPRTHNPRGTRLERFHRWVADWFRAMPGWIGANTRERKMTHGDADVEKHKLWCVGKLALGEGSPLLNKDQLLVETDKMMEAWRDHNSQGTDMCGLTPRAVFVQCSPPSGFRRISEDDLAFATAQHFENQAIKLGGIIELRDGSRYSHPLLNDLAGETREVVRLRHDHLFVTVLPAKQGEEAIIAPRRVRVGTKDPDELSRQSELQARLRKLTGAMVKPLEYEPGVQFEAAESQVPKTVETIHPAESVTGQDAPPIAPEHEVGSVEYLMEHDRYQKRVKRMDFADLEG